MKDKRTHTPLTNIQDILPILHKIAIFGGLSENHLDALCRLLESVVYKAGERIFGQGEEPKYIYIVRSGEVKIVINIDTEPLEIVAFRAGQCFGEMALIGIQSHSASAVAVTDTELIVLSSDALCSINRTDKELFGLLMLNIAREACRRLHQTDKTLLHYFQKNSNTEH